MCLSALFEEFCHFLRVEKEATPATIATYQWCFGDFEAFVMKQVGGTVLLTHFTEETCRSYRYDLAGRAGRLRTRPLMSTSPARPANFKDRVTLRIGDWADIMVYHRDELGYVYNKPT